MTSPAERQRRYRRHAKGDHSLCDPARRCEAEAHAQTVEALVVTAALAEQVGPTRGTRFLDACRTAGLGVLYEPLAQEAARMIDRLDRLHASLERRGEWFRHEVDDTGLVVIQIDNVLGEARAQAATLNTITNAIVKALPKREEPADDKPERGGALADLRLLAGGA